MMKNLFKRMFRNERQTMNSEDRTIDYLILNGALEVAGVDSENNELTYLITSKMEHVMPDLYKEHLNFVNSEIMALWERGFVSFDLFEEDPTLFFTEKAMIADEVNKLPKQQRWSLEELKRILKR